MDYLAILEPLTPISQVPPFCLLQNLGILLLGILSYSPLRTDIWLQPAPRGFIKSCPSINYPKPHAPTSNKTTEVMLAITLPKWTNKNNGFTYMLSIKPNFCQKTQKSISPVQNQFYQCISLMPSILYCLNYNGSSNQEGHSTYQTFNWAKNSYQNKHKRNKSKFFSLILPKIILKLYQ
jgi:hypothetical protein